MAASFTFSSPVGWVTGELALDGALVGISKSRVKGTLGSPGTSITFDAISGGTTAPTDAPYTNNGGTPTAGDLLVAAFATASSSLTVTPPAGWTHEFSVSSSGSASAVTLSVFTKIAVAGDISGTLTFTFPSRTAVGYLNAFDQPATVLAHATSAATANGTLATGPAASVGPTHSIVGFEVVSSPGGGTFHDCDFLNRSLNGIGILLGYRYEVVQTHRGWVQDNDRW